MNTWSRTRGVASRISLLACACIFASPTQAHHVSDGAQPSNAFEHFVEHVAHMTALELIVLGFALIAVATACATLMTTRTSAAGPTAGSEPSSRPAHAMNLIGRRYT